MRILIAIGSTEQAEQILTYAVTVVGASSEPPTVLTVVRRAGARAQGEKLLRYAREILDPLLENYETQLRVGMPVQEIVQAAQEGDFDLLIVGEPPPGSWPLAWKRASMGVRVMESATIPVLLARGELRAPQRILLCDSGVESPSALSHFVAKFSLDIEGEEDVTVLHVMSQISAGPGVRGEQLRADAQDLIEEHTPEGEMLQRDMELLDQGDIHPHAKIRHGLVIEEIQAEARSGDYDLVVIGAHRGEGWQRVLLDDLAHKLLSALDRPILMVR